MARRQVPGTVYLIHFERPYRHAAHYLGWSERLEERLAEHRAGRGARLMEVVAEAHIDWTVARTWDGTRARERQLNKQGGRSRLCPLCRANHQPASTTTAAPPSKELHP